MRGSEFGPVGKVGKGRSGEENFLQGTSVYKDKNGQIHDKIVKKLFAISVYNATVQ